MCLTVLQQAVKHHGAARLGAPQAADVHGLAHANGSGNAAVSITKTHGVGGLEKRLRRPTERSNTRRSLNTRQAVMVRGRSLWNESATTAGRARHRQLSKGKNEPTICTRKRDVCADRGSDGHRQPAGSTGQDRPVCITRQRHWKKTWIEPLRGDGQARGKQGAQPGAP